MYDVFLLKIESGCNKYVPIVDMNLIRNKHAPWINADLKYLIRKKKNLRYKNCVSKWRDEELKKEYSVCCKQVKD
jgi:transposase-like protein